MTYCYRAGVFTCGVDGDVFRNVIRMGGNVFKNGVPRNVHMHVDLRRVEPGCGGTVMPEDSRS